MSKPNKQHLEDAWKEFERTGEICNAASGLLDYATVLTEINQLQSEENKQLAEDNEKLREALTNVLHAESHNTGYEPSLSVFHRYVDEALQLLESMK